MKKRYLTLSSVLLFYQLALGQSPSGLFAPAGQLTAKQFSNVEPPEASTNIGFRNPPRILREDALAVTGTVRDENAQPFPGVNIIVKGTTTGTTTDVNGRYALQVDDDNATLVFSFVGYDEQEIALAGRSVIDVQMVPNLRALDEVVVTALGIERAQKSLGYATTKVNADELTINRTPNMMNSLTGKIAGVNIAGLGTGPAGTSKIRIRGQSSISGQNSPLIVVNGVPMDNTNFGTNPMAGMTNSDGSIATRGGGITSDGGDGLMSINPDDVESMTVLKGAAAAALYGSRAKDGVIMITTKSRGTQRGLGITYNMNFTDETPLDFTDYQYVYGQGEYGLRPGPTASNPTGADPQSGQWSFGEKFEPGMTQVLFDAVGSNAAVPYKPQRGIIKQFYRHGTNFSNSIGVSANGDKGGLHLSFSNLKALGITPNNSFERQTINLGFGYDLSKKLSFKGNVNYSNEYNKNPPVIAEQDNSIPTSLLAMANSMPMKVLEANKYNANGAEYSYSRFQNRTNPYWALAEQFQNIRRDRIFGNVSAKYNLTDWLSIQGRFGQDYWSRDHDYVNQPTGKASLTTGSIAAAVSGFVNGIYTQEVRRFRETNADFLLSATKDFGDIGVNASFGGNQMKRRSDLNSVQVTDFVVKGLYTVQNGRAKDALYDLQERAVNSLYGAAEINFKEFIYLNATIRNDWFSTLSPENRSILYPSVSASYIFSESLSMPSWLTFGKFRAAFAQVGSDLDVPPYSDVLFYGVSANFYNGQPVGNSGAIVPNPNLVPMRTSETELGLEMRMFDSRVNVDLAVYKKLTMDQIVNAQISDGSGFTSMRINSGESQNKGVELMLNVLPVATNNFQWDFTFACAYNITEVLSLITDKPGESITVGTHVFNGSVQQIVGKEMGQIVGYGYRRYDGSVHAENKGKIVYGSDGLPLTTLTQIPFGSALPKWTGGITNSFDFNGIQFSFLIDFKLGNKMLSGTNFNAYRHGLHKATLVGRDNIPGTNPDPAKEVGGIVVGEGVNAAGEPNTAGARVQDFYSVVRSSALIEPVIFNGGYWKLRQVSIGYDFTRFLPENFPVKGIKLSLVSNNVLLLKKWVDNIDPDTFGYSSDNLVGMESPGVPTTRSIGFNLNVKL